jgi:hypothetical protein
LAAFRMGNQMIRSGETWVDRLVGTAIQSLATRLPLSKDAIPPAKGADVEERNRLHDQARANALRTYVRKHHLGAEGDWMLRQYVAGTKLVRLSRQDTGSPSRIKAYERTIRADYLRYWSTILLVQLLGALFVLAFLSGLRGMRPSGGALSAIGGILGALVTSAAVLYIGRHWWILGMQQFQWASKPENLVISANATWTMVAILPAVVVLAGLISLLRRKGFLGSLYNSLRWALPVTIILYIAASAITSADRAQYERRIIRSLRGPTAVQAEMLRKTGFLQQNRHTR